MRERRITVNTPHEQISAFVKFAAKYAPDYFTEQLSIIHTWPLEKLFREIRKRYTLEQGEQIIRPLYYWQDGVGGDCDDAFIQYTAFFLAAGVPKSKIIVCEAREPGADSYTHIFCALDTDKGIIYLDNLPESRFNKLDYPGELCRFTRLSDYI